MAEIYNFSNYGQAAEIIAAQAAAQTYGNLAVALENNPGWSVIEGSKITTIGETVGSPKVVPISQYVKTAAELEGGVVSATEAVEVAETGVVAGEVSAGASGLFAGWTIGTAVAGVLAGVGVGITMYDSNPQFWVDVSNAIFPGEDIDYNSIKDYTIVGLIKGNNYGQEAELDTFLSKYIAERILNVASNYNMFTFGTGMRLDDTSPLYYPNNYTFPILLSKMPMHALGVNWTGDIYFEFLNNTEPVYGVMLYDGNSVAPYFWSDSPFDVRMYGMYASLTAASALTREGETFYNWHTFGSFRPPADQIVNNVTSLYNECGWDLGYMYKHGTHIDIRADGVYELPDNPTIYNPNSSLDLQYPAWLARGLNTHGLSLPYDDPSLYPIPWIPVTMPDADPLQSPERYPLPSQEPSPEPAPYPAQDPQPWAQRGRLPDEVPYPYGPPTDNFPKKNPDDGDDKPDDKKPPVTPTPTPPIVFPTIGGEANAIFTVYKPVLSELNSLAGVLWSSNFLENLIKIFTNNPMDAIISLHMLYATPSVGGRQNIKLGCYDSGVASDVVNKQYLEIDCGTVRIPEYFGDVRDYVNTVVDVYLPFVGMRHLKTQDIVGSYVTIKAGVDVFTGTILYTINIRKSSGINQVMYAFEGNCAVALPLTGADKSRMFSVLGAAATGGAIGGVAGAAVGALTSVMNGSQQADIQRTGNFGANSGAMGVKKPYIVVSRNVGYDANNYSYYHGFPANKTVRLGSCSGFTRVLDCRVDGISGATDAEKRMIEDALKTGVVI